jgi:hypothetical protein
MSWRFLEIIADGFIERRRYTNRGRACSSATTSQLAPRLRKRRGARFRAPLG